MWIGYEHGTIGYEHGTYGTCHVHMLSYRVKSKQHTTKRLNEQIRSTEHIRLRPSSLPTQPLPPASHIQNST
jgi:hypothetical protein